MNDLVPLKVLGRNELEASVLRSADADQAPPEAMQRVATTLGVSASVMALSSTAGAASAAVLGTAAVVKSLLVGVGAGMLVSGALFTASVVTEPSRPSPASKQAGESEMLGSQRGTVRPLTPASPTTDATPARPSASPVAPRAFEFPPPSPAEPAPTATSSVAEEVAVLDRARALLAAGKASDALRALDAHALRHPNAVMALEATVVRVEAELARGNRTSAERYARALIAAHPNTGHARKVMKLLERANDE